MSAGGGERKIDDEQERANSKAGQVYDAVKEAILSGELEPGQAIDKLALCERLGVSRFPVSAAISRLAFERLVRVEPQHGSFVAPISVEGVRENLFVRRALEGEIAAEAAAAARRRGAADLAANLAEAEEAARGGRPRAVLCARRRLSRAADASISACIAARRFSTACASIWNGRAGC